MKTETNCFSYVDTKNDLFLQISLACAGKNIAIIKTFCY